ncbi:MAG: DTW domain-containing protein [Deltaproteobacteria bacterium]|nr:DTW domain-containing protein [Deltaproteobacteria bacterium]
MTPFQVPSEYRSCCWRCRRPLSGCYCPLIRSFASEPRFIILSQPREAKHRLGTGRMAHLCLNNSTLNEGVDFSSDRRVNQVIDDPKNFSVVLYPSSDSINLSNLNRGERAALFPRRQQLVVFVLDGTWKSVRKMIGLSENLRRLPTVSFTPVTPSSYRIRRQPRPQFYSTIEAIHQVIDLFAVESDGNARPHDNLLAVFAALVDRQLTYTPQSAA